MSKVSSTLQLHNDFYSSAEQVSLPNDAAKQKDQDERETSCGIGNCRPRWLQKLAHPLPFLIVYSILGMVQGLLWSYYVGVFTTLEKRYSYKSKITGIISLSDNFGIIIASLLIGYFGGHGHRPRWIAIGMIVAAIGALISASPYWIFGASKRLKTSSNSTSNELCVPWNYNDNDTDTDWCRGRSGQNSYETVPAVSLVILGNIVNGIGLTAFYVVGAPYLDDNVKKTSTPIYFGLMYAVRLVGPALGFFLASFTLNFYEDPSVDPEFGQTDPRWIGAWWLGFVIIAGLLLILSSILYLFPRKMKWDDGSKEDSSNNHNHQTTSDPENNNSAMTKHKLKELTLVVKTLLKNRILICRYIGECLNLLGTLGFVLFMPKYLENHFRQGASEANKMAGLAGTMFMVVGFSASAVAIWKLKPSPRTVSAWIVLTGILNAAGLIGAGFISCQDHNVVTTSSCGDQNVCQCNTKLFTPVCYRNETYFSSCFVGCKNVDSENGTKIYSNCNCNGDTAEDYFDDEVSSGFCKTTCGIFIYLVIIVITNLLSSSAKVGGLLITLRCIEPEHKSVALALSSVMISLFAFIPCPLLYGAVVDSACDTWGHSCGQTGNCWIYDLDKFRYLLHGLSAAFILLGSFFDSIVCYLSKSIESLYDSNLNIPAAKTELKRESSSNGGQYGTNM